MVVALIFLEVTLESDSPAYPFNTRSKFAGAIAIQQRHGFLRFIFLLKRANQPDKERAIILQMPVKHSAFANGRAPAGSSPYQPGHPPRQPPLHKIILRYPPAQEPCGTLPGVYVGCPVRQGSTHPLQNVLRAPRLDQPTSSRIRSLRQQS